jgi:hypothetical protein
MGAVVEPDKTPQISPAGEHDRQRRFFFGQSRGRGTDIHDVRPHRKAAAGVENACAP